jgi:CubicO group peptidase (beta-lactamase class C family)
MLRYREGAGIPDIFSCKNAALMLPLAFDPGDRWEYGINIDWIGKAVERISGQKLGDYFAEHLFRPIGMKDTGFKLTPERRARLVGMHPAALTASSREWNLSCRRNRSSKWEAAASTARRPITWHSQVCFCTRAAPAVAKFCSLKRCV